MRFSQVSPLVARAYPGSDASNQTRPGAQCLRKTFESIHQSATVTLHLYVKCFLYASETPNKSTGHAPPQLFDDKLSRDLFMHPNLALRLHSPTVESAFAPPQWVFHFVSDRGPRQSRHQPHH